MPVDAQDLRKAMVSLGQFRANAKSPFHERYSFPFFSGSYFAYRKVDVMRVVAVAKAVSENPSYLDVGCGYGDFLKRIRQYIIGAKGIEKSGGIFYQYGISKPDFIEIADASWIDKKHDIIFVGWMEPGQDFRDIVASHTDVIVTTLDQGISLAAEFDGHGFNRVASWVTPSWEDVNTEIMNQHYTRIDEDTRQRLSKLRGVHNIWYVYARPNISAKIREGVEKWLEKEGSFSEHYDFESVLDECGFGYMERLENPAVIDPLWQVRFC